MEAVLQLSLLTVSVCLGAAAVLRRATARLQQTDRPRIQVGPVSDAWLMDHRTRSRPE